MRTILFSLALLAIAKVWYQDRTYRAAMSDAVVEAYRDRAAEACRRGALKRAPGAREVNPNTWTTPAAVEAVMGNPDLNVAIWDTQNPQWYERFRDPHIVLTSQTGQRCAYDIHKGGTTLLALAR